MFRGLLLAAILFSINCQAEPTALSDEGAHGYISGRQLQCYDSECEGRFNWFYKSIACNFPKDCTLNFLIKAKQNSELKLKTTEVMKRKLGFTGLVCQVQPEVLKLCQSQKIKGKDQYTCPVIEISCLEFPIRNQKELVLGRIKEKTIPFENYESGDLFSLLVEEWFFE